MNVLSNLVPGILWEAMIITFHLSFLSRNENFGFIDNAHLLQGH